MRLFGLNIFFPNLFYIVPILWRPIEFIIDFSLVRKQDYVMSAMFTSKYALPIYLFLVGSFWNETQLL